MPGPLRHDRLGDYAVALAFGVIVVAFGSSLGLPVPLYVAPRDCSTCLSNIPTVPVLPLLAGVTSLLIIERRHMRPFAAVRGVTLGIVGALFTGLQAAAVISLRDPYVASAYRAYAIGILFLVTAAGVAYLVSHLSSRQDSALGASVVLPLLGVVVASIPAAALRRELLPALVMTLGAILGTSSLLVRNRARFPAPHSERLPVAAVVFAAFALRLLFGLQLAARSPNGMAFAINSDDGDSYYRLATDLAAHPLHLDQVLGGIAFPPGYTIFLATIFGLTHFSIPVVVVVQALLSAAAAWLVWRITRRFAGPRAALIAAFLFAFDANLIQDEATLTPESVLIPLLLLAILGLYMYRDSRRSRWLLAAAVALAAAFVTRNVAAIPLVGIASLWLLFATPGGWLPRLGRVGFVMVALVLATAPIALATSSKAGGARITTQLAPLAFEFTGGTYDPMGNGPLLARDIDPFADLVGSVRRTAQDPGYVAAFYARVVPLRFRTLLFSDVPGDSDPLLLVDPIKKPNAYGQLIQLLRLAALITVIIGFVVQWRRGSLGPDPILIIGFVLLYVAAFTLLFAPYHPFRYRIPIEPFRYMAEGIGFAIMTRWTAERWSVRGRSRRPAMVHSPSEELA